MDVSPNILPKNQNFKKERHSFVDERALITARLICYCHWKTIVPFCLLKKRPEFWIFNTNSELSQNYSAKQIMPFKTTLNWLLNYMLCYLVMGGFD